MYVVRYKDLNQAIDEKRKLVKLTDPNLWKPSWPLTKKDWEAGHEIRSDSIGISLFTTGTEEKLHYHERTWEIYQVLEGTLRIAVKPFRKGEWSGITLHQHDMVILVPGTLHLVDRLSNHTSQVIQAPPAISDQIVIPANEDKITEEERENIEAAQSALERLREEKPNNGTHPTPD